MAGNRPNIDDFVEDTGSAAVADELELDLGSDEGAGESSAAGEAAREIARDGQGRFAGSGDDLDDDDDLGADSDLDAADGESMSLRDALAARGMQVEGDDETVLGQMLEYVTYSQQEQARWQQEQQRYQQQFQQYQQYIANLEQQRQWYAQQQYAQQMQHAGAQQREYRGRLAYLNKVPEFDPQWMQFLQRGEDGNLTVVNGGDPTLPQKYLARQEWEKAALRAQLEDPVGFYEETLLQSPRVQQWMQQAVMQYVQPMVAQQQQYVQQHLAYQEHQRADATRITQEVQQFAMTADGQMTMPGYLYLQAIQDIAGDPRFAHYPVRAQHDMALAKVAPLMQSQQQPAAQPQPRQSRAATNGAQKRINIMKHAAAGTTGRGGSLPRSERRSPVRRSNLTLDQEIERDLRAAGLLA